MLISSCICELYLGVKSRHIFIFSFIPQNKMYRGLNAEITINSIKEIA